MNINKHEYERKGLDGVIPSKRIFFWDDLHPQSPLCEDTTGHCFREAPGRMATVKPRFTITKRELNCLRQLIFPVARIDLPKRLPKRDDDKRADHERRLKLLDHHQESIAREYDGGRRIITGPSGSGKTLILVHRAALLKQFKPAIRNILFVCCNITLVNCVRRHWSETGPRRPKRSTLRGISGGSFRKPSKRLMARLPTSGLFPTTKKLPPGWPGKFGSLRLKKATPMSILFAKTDVIC